jgi:uncharacterized protein (TIGR03085 family)
MDPARTERAELCDLFAELGPDAPTLCEGWATADLAAHLLVRETRPDAAIGLVVKPLHGRTEKVEGEVRATRPYAEVVERLRAGPPTLSPGRIPGGWRADLHEWLVHHEDVRRANGLGPKEDGEAQRRRDDAVWSILPLWGPVLGRRLAATTTLVTEDGRRRRIHRGQGTLELHGRPSELLLALFGRRQVADVTAIGDPEAVGGWEQVALGL